MLAAGAIRHASYYPTLEDSNKRGIKLGHIFSALALLGEPIDVYDQFDLEAQHLIRVRRNLGDCIRTVRLLSVFYSVSFARSSSSENRSTGGKRRQLWSRI